MLYLLLWAASTWSLYDAGKVLWRRDWMELVWVVGRTAMLVFLAIAAGATHAHWDDTAISLR